MVLGTKWYEFWVRNGMPGVGISTEPALHPYCSICAALVGLKGILWSNMSPCDSIKLYLLKNMILYVKYNNNFGTKWYDFGYEMVWDETVWVRDD